MAAYTTIDNPELYFQVKTYTGNSSGSTTQAITLDGDENMQPDMVWLKSRTDAEKHWLVDSVRGITNGLNTHLQDAETSNISMVSFNTNGFTVGTDNYSINKSGSNYASWCWKADNSSGSSNSDGSVTSTVAANTTLGFSIARFTGSGSNLTIGHGLGAKPDFIMLKCTSSGSTDWTCYHSSLGATKRIKLNASDASSTNSTTWQDTEPTTSVISVGTSGDVNVSSGTHIAYCFAEKKGYSKFGSYTGNGNADGTFVYTGFKPAFLIIKQTDFGNSWRMYDNKRSTFNVVTKELYPNTYDAEATTDKMDFVSNGFKFRTSASNANGSGSPYIYIAFAESSFVNSNGVPCNAR